MDAVFVYIGRYESVDFWSHAATPRYDIYTFGALEVLDDNRAL